MSLKGTGPLVIGRACALAGDEDDGEWWTSGSEYLGKRACRSLLSSRSWAPTLIGPAALDTGQPYPHTSRQSRAYGESRTRVADLARRP